MQCFICGNEENVFHHIKKKKTANISWCTNLTVILSYKNDWYAHSDYMWQTELCSYSWMLMRRGSVECVCFVLIHNSVEIALLQIKFTSWKCYWNNLRYFTIVSFKRFDKTHTHTHTHKSNEVLLKWSDKICSYSLRYWHATWATIKVWWKVCAQISCRHFCNAWSCTTNWMLLGKSVHGIKITAMKLKTNNNKKNIGKNMNDLAQKKD